WLRVAGLKQLNWASEGVGSKAAALVDLSTVAGNKISNPPWVKFQSAGWVNFPSAPTPWDLVNLIARQNRWKLQIHGADAVRRFGLSTQMPVIPIYYTSGPSRSIFVGKAEIRLVHAAPMVMQCAGTKVGMTISALFYLGKGGTTPECVAVIKKALSPEDLSKIVACRMPKWMRAALETT
ncbi:TPA: DUF6088 family protein, partial [Pseudomonas aeruginosa]